MAGEDALSMCGTVVSLVELFGTGSLVITLL